MHRGRIIVRRVAPAVALLIAGAATAWWWQDEGSTESERGRTPVADPHEDDVSSPAVVRLDGSRSSVHATRAAAESAAMSDVDSVSAPDAPIRGVVVDPAGDPIAGATVQAMDWLGNVSAKVLSDANGEFAFGKLHPDARHLHVAAPGRLSTIVAVVERPDRWYQFQCVSNPARIVLLPGVVAVARLRWVDGSPCAGVAVHLGPSYRGSTGIDHEPQVGPWPPPITDEEGRVAIEGLPPERVVGLGIDLLGRNEDSPRPLATGTAISAAAATEQLFVYPNLTTLTVELRGLEAIEAAHESGALTISRTDGFRGEASETIPPFVARFDRIVLGGRYRIVLSVLGRRTRALADAVTIVEKDQHLVFDGSLTPSDSTPPKASPFFTATFELLRPDREPITLRDLLDAGFGPAEVALHYGSLTAETRDAPAGAGTLELESDGEESAAARGRLFVHAEPPLWLEARIGPLRSRVELDHADDSARVRFTFDLAPLSIGLTRLSFRVRGARETDAPIAIVQLADASSGCESFATPVSPGLISRMVRPGSYHYQCFASSGSVAEGDVEVPSGSPVTVEVALPDPGDICGTVAPMPDAARVVVNRSPVRGARTRFDWWSGCPVGPDGSYALDGVPPGEWRLLLTIVSPDQSSVRVETATVTVKSDSITRHDFAPSGGPTRRFRLELGAAERALVHATDAHDETVVDGMFPAGVNLDLPVAALHFSAAPQIRDERGCSWDTSHWTAGRITAGSDGVAIVRFDFSDR